MTESRKAIAPPATVNSNLKRATPQLEQHSAPKLRPAFLWILLSLVVVSAGATIYWIRRSQYVRELAIKCKVARELENWEELELLAVDWGLNEPLNATPFEHAAVAAYRLGALDRSYGYLTQMPESGTLESLLLKGEIEHQLLNDPLASIESCKKVIALAPSNSEAHHRLLYFWAMSRQLEQLKTEIDRGIQQEASTLETYAYWFAFDKLRFADAAPINKSWADKYPMEESFHVATVLALSLMPQFSELQREGDLKILEERFPNNREVIFSQLERAIERGDDIRVDSLLQSKKDILDADFRYWRSKGWLETERGHFDEATIAFENAVKLGPLDWQTKSEWALLKRKQNLDNSQSEDLAISAQQGRTLFEQLKRADSIFSLQNSFYNDLANYFEQCGLNVESEAIRKRVRNEAP